MTNTPVGLIAGLVVTAIVVYLVIPVLTMNFYRRKRIQTNADTIPKIRFDNSGNVDDSITIVTTVTNTTNFLELLKVHDIKGAS